MKNKWKTTEKKKEHVKQKGKRNIQKKKKVI